MTTILKGHHSLETAFVSENYPYGFKLRCKKRYWLEYHPKHGIRLVTQTTNPKKPGEVWNAPKMSTYCRFAGCLYLDDNNHVQWTGMHEYMSTDECVAWAEKWGEGVPEATKPLALKWVAAKIAYDQKKAA